ncbi:amidohydrolase [Sphingomonas sp. G-3-2-10]|uniref:amidohydrolase n=1 Tax=Sphingomonas sp. G-3-2-10 TaxID=2728838 RepID=UPI00146E4D01|nr:amidohydrolase [Sphingomonas sp. G-3-2-10]NML04210.1 amidohydrolase [Sphingomonas sp. G-3-2-10]
MLRHLLLSAAALAMTATPPLAAAAAAAAADPVRDATQKAMPQLMDFYRDFHANPELSNHETRSAGILAAEARRLGFDVTEKVGGHGVVAILRNGPGPVIMIRADMDGLPVVEQTGLPFASKAIGTAENGVETGIMHACGHDTHMASWIGTMRNLVAMKAKWSGTLIMIGQPAEEVGTGAKAMIADGLFTRWPKPSHALAFHDVPSLPAGTIGIRTGYVMAAVDWVDITVKGVGGHGAYPHKTKDPIVLASRLVVALQTLVSREVDPLESAVVTVGSFHGGAKPNVISDTVQLQLTVRSYKPEVRKLLLDGIGRIARGEAIAAGMPDDKMPEVIIKPGATPATFNTEPFTGRMTSLFTARFGADRVVDLAPQMGGEDFANFYVLDPSVQSLLFFVGGVPRAQWDASQKPGGPGLPSLHSPFWAPDAEGVISTATEAMTAAALDLLRKK